MNSITSTLFYHDVIKEFNYDFGDIFVFDKFVVSEVKTGVNFDYNNAQEVIIDVSRFLGTSDGASINFISNRINSYSVMASDWVRFFKEGYVLNSYIVVSNKKRFSNVVIEKLFFDRAIKQFSDLEEAINFVKNDMMKIE